MSKKLPKQANHTISYKDILDNIPSISVLSDQSLVTEYNIDVLPICFGCFNINNFSKNEFTFPSHWHPDIEFYYVIHGSMNVFVNGQIFPLMEGQGLFINSRRLHFSFKRENEDCDFIVITYRPSSIMLFSESMQSYIEQRFSPQNVDYIVLSTDIDWCKIIIDQILDIAAILKTKDPNPMRLALKLSSICADICDHIEPVEVSKKENLMQLEFLKMTDFIHNNYQKKISLDDIAKAGGVCRSKCCQLFKQFVRLTPNTYLTRCRLTKSRRLLSNTDLSIAEIAEACGFQSSTYFATLFKNGFGETPIHHRESFKNRIDL